jgi:hypothetical protein
LRVSQLPRVARLAARVSQARRPKRSRTGPGASSREIDQPVFAPAQRLQLVQGAQSARSAQPAQTLEPALSAGLARADAHPPAPELPISEEAVRWLTQGAVPAGLVPLLGDPAFPDAEVGSAPEPDQRQGVEPAAAPALVISRVTEGAREQAPAMRPQSAPAFEADDDAFAYQGAPDSARPSAWEGPLTTVQEFAPSARDGQPLLRLARQPQRSASTDSARELAHMAGAQETSDGAGRSTVTFSDARPVASADAGCPAETPLAGAVRQRLGDLDLDEIYDGLLQRLRRDLLHDRERLGDLLGPIR